MQVTFLPVREQAALELYSPQLVAWIYETGPRHFEWLFGNRELAFDNLAAWTRRANSQFSGLTATLVLSDDEPAGVFLARAGKELPACQRADIMVLMKSYQSGERVELMRRLPLLSGMEAPVDPADYYLRILAVDAAHRGKGLGRRLLQQYVDDGTAAKFQRFRVDVRSDNAAALALYRSAGFETLREGTGVDSGGDYKVASMLMVK